MAFATEIISDIMGIAVDGCGDFEKRLKSRKEIEDILRRRILRLSKSTRRKGIVDI
jgi:hypothetical protein